MDILFISARYIYEKDSLAINNHKELLFEELPLFKKEGLAAKLKSFSKAGNTIIFIDPYPYVKRHNEELANFFGKEDARGEILFYRPTFGMQKLHDYNEPYETIECCYYLETIPLGTNVGDMYLLLGRLNEYFSKQGKIINNILYEKGDFELLTQFEINFFNNLLPYSINNKDNLPKECVPSKCDKPIKILFTDKDGTILGGHISQVEKEENLKLLQQFTDEGNIVVIITAGHGCETFKGFGFSYNNPNLYGMLLTKIATVCINETGDLQYEENYPSLPLALDSYASKADAVEMFLKYFLQKGYTFESIYAIGDSENDLSMINYINNIGGNAKLIGRDIDKFSSFMQEIKCDKIIIDKLRKIKGMTTYENNN